LTDRFGQDDDPALVRLARIAHAADIESDPAGLGLSAIGVGGLVERDDHRRLERASFVYDTSYAWCQLETR